MSRPPHEHHLIVRYAETDQMGVAHHANFLLYMEEARTAMMKAAGCSYRSIEESGFGLPVRKAEVRYRASALYEDELVIRTRLARSRAASVTFEYEIERVEDGLLLATGSTELACIRLDGDRKPVALPDELVRLIGLGQAENAS